MYCVECGATKEDPCIPACDENDSYTTRVLRNLPTVSGDDLSHIKNTIAQLCAKRFSVGDAISYCACLEEVSPNLDEEMALVRMSRLNTKYKFRMHLQEEKCTTK